MGTNQMVSIANSFLKVALGGDFSRDGTTGREDGDNFFERCSLPVEQVVTR